MATFAPGSFVWLEDPEERFLPCKVLTAFKKGEQTEVEMENGQKRKVTKADDGFICECFPEALDDNKDDMVNISDLNEMAILHQLRIRFKVDRIYTYISSILISVNPFKMIPLYTPEYLEKYRTGDRSLPPHAFAVAYNAYNNMLQENADQCVVCSGESGAGKSEATKVVLQFLTDAAMRNTKPTADGKTTNLAAMVMSANPILEAFGNAKTLRNNNSSRFGKLITMKFDRGGGIVGGAIINYLLEKSRVVMQIKNERNYHIFYQCITNCETNAAMSETLKLKNAEDFAYINTSGVIKIPGMNDKHEYDDVENSMKILNFSEEQQMGIWKVVSGVLWLGNCIYVKDGDEGSKITNPDIIPHAADMWGVDHTALTPLLTTRLVGKEKIVSPLNLVQALDCRDALTKKVYGDTFQWTVDKINLELSNNNAPFERFIGVLDIFGFESFEINSFEQLCINFCNEKLQFHFNTHIFKMEQALYQTEGINLPDSSFKDNQPTLDLLELKGTGMIPMLDEELNVPKGSDDGFLSKIIKLHDKKHPNFLKPGSKDCKESARSFGVLHYAGAVYYYIQGWLDKNKDQISVDLGNVLRESKSPFIQGVFPPEIVDPKGKTPPKLTLGTQFKNQLNNLIDTLNSTFPQFVRCMKSNNKKVGGIFEAKLMQDQLRYAGLVEVCRIRKLGYPGRRAFNEFFRRYKHIDLTCTNLDMLLKSLSAKKILIDGEWAKGTTRVFYRMDQNVKLEIAREAAFLTVALKLQKVGRGCYAKNKFIGYRAILKTLKDSVASRKEEELGPAIDNSTELPFDGGHLAIVKEAKALIIRVKEENRCSKLLEEAMVAQELENLKAAIAACDGLSPPFVHAKSAEAKSLITKLEAEIAYREALKAAIAARDMGKLNDAISKGQAAGVSGDIMTQATNLQARLQDEMKILDEISAACDKEDVEKCQELFAKAASLGVEGPDFNTVKAKFEKLQDDIRKKLEADPEYAAKIRKAKEEAEAAAKKEAEEKRAREEAIASTTAKLEAAMAAGDSGTVNALLATAMSLGITTNTVKAAQEYMQTQGSSEVIKTKMEAAIKVIKSKTEGITEADLAALKEQIAKAEQAKSPELEEAIAAAMTQLRTFNKHVAAGAALVTATASKDRVKLRNAIGEILNLQIKVEGLDEAKRVLKALEVEYRQQKASGAALPEGTLDYDSAETNRKAKAETFRELRFEHKNYPALRTAEDFSKGALINKAKVKESFLVWQSNVIPKSLTDLTAEHSKLAMQLHKDLLGWCGDKQMPYPGMLAQDILRKGYEIKPLRDEIYLQLIKHLTNNPKPESMIRAWQVFCMCCATFPPSFELEGYVQHFILDKKEKGKGASADYARYCARTLEATIANGDGTGFVPSIEEIQAYKERPPVLVTVQLVDGNIVTEDLPVTPDLNVGTIIEMCTGWMGLKDPRCEQFGLFVYDLGDMDGEIADVSAPYRSLKRTPRPLRNDDFLGDVIVQRTRQRRKFKFVLKKKIFLPQHNVRGPDPFYERLIYLQAEDDTIIQGHIPMDDEERVVALAGMSMAVAYGDELGYSVEDLVNAKVVDFIMPDWRAKKSAPEWAKMILEMRDTLVASDPEDLQESFLQIVQGSPFYGTHWFYVIKADAASTAAMPQSVKNLPSEIMLGFNQDGLNVCDTKHKPMITFAYADILKWNGSTGTFTLTLNEPSLPDPFEFPLHTAQGSDIAAIILDHIKAVMVEQEIHLVGDSGIGAS